MVLAFWTRLLPFDQVARLFGVSWQGVNDIVSAAIALRAAARNITKK